MFYVDVKDTTSHVVFHFIEQRLMNSNPTRLAVPGNRFPPTRSDTDIYREHRVVFIK